MNEVLLCILIAAGKATEILLYTLRTVLSTKNQKKAVTILGLLNNSIGIIVLITVIGGIQENIWRAIAFAIGETIGTYLGMILDKKLAFGKAVLTIIISKNSMDKIIKKLSEKGYKVTYMLGKGLKEDRAILKIFANRKQKPEIISILNEENAKAVIFDNNILNYKSINEA